MIKCSKKILKAAIPCIIVLVLLALAVPKISNMLKKSELKYYYPEVKTGITATVDESKNNHHGFDNLIINGENVFFLTENEGTIYYLLNGDEAVKLDEEYQGIFKSALK